MPTLARPAATAPTSIGPTPPQDGVVGVGSWSEDHDGHWARFNAKPRCIRQGAVVTSNSLPAFTPWPQTSALADAAHSCIRPAQHPSIHPGPGLNHPSPQHSTCIMIGPFSTLSHSLKRAGVPQRGRATSRRLFTLELENDSSVLEVVYRGPASTTPPYLALPPPDTLFPLEAVQPRKTAVAF
ncbi:hypothetical protein AOQ84DRAFT_371927 [Glonium stellatum]|uniref:Uncharacterized protein n=1 Tax=Glonium stellatum TaxID=574774 RepID=A0A8E2JYD4_9PEZI|nr:hypothetical protein AOQ84DRAFT_371927 [Glonium stellatum]